MSYSIYYDRAFIRIGDKFIPLANYGSNNCWEYYGRRQVPEKAWNVLNWRHETQFLFSESEIKRIAHVYDRLNQQSGMMFKSRNRCFEHGEFERWIINGMKRAYTVEEYVSFGNSFFILDYSKDGSSGWEKHYFKTTDELLSILDNLKDIRRKEIKLCDNRSVYRPKNSKAPKKRLSAADLPEYYVLTGEVRGSPAYFVKLTRHGGFRYTALSTSGSIKIFKTEKEALAYLKKYQAYLGKYNFAPEKIVNAATPDCGESKGGVLDV